jgi:hypothetical protein
LKKAKFTLIAAALAVLPSASASGPDATTNHFMKEPVSLLDFGIYKISNLLHGRDGQPNGWASYDFDSNTINIEFNSFEASGNDKLEDHLARCDEWIEGIRSVGLVSSTTGKPIGMPVSMFAQQFSHVGYILGDSEENQERLIELDKKFRLRMTIFDRSFKGVLECTAKLLGKGFASRELKR